MITGGDDSGSMLSGKWFNPATGETIMVRNAVETPDGMQIMTSIGPMTGEQFSQFVKAEEEGAAPQASVQAAPPQQPNFGGEEALAELNSAKALVTQTNTPQVKQEIVQQPQPTNSNQQILKKLFDKKKTEPQIKIQIEWDEFPKSELETFINVLDISREDIASYIIENYLDTYHMIEAVSDFLDNELEK